MRKKGSEGESQHDASITVLHSLDGVLSSARLSSDEELWTDQGTRNRSFALIFFSFCVTICLIFLSLLHHSPRENDSFYLSRGQYYFH